MSGSIGIEYLLEGNTESAFKYPEEIGHFSVDADRKIHLDRSMMRYYVPQAKNDQRLDLNVGYEDKPGMRDSSNRMDQLLKWIVRKGFEPVQNSSSASVDNDKSLLIVCLRGTIKKLLCTPYERKNKWILCACRYEDVIYFRTDDEKIESQLNLSKEERKMIAWGYKFEQYMTADRPDGTPNPSSPNHDQEEFCIVATNKIGDHKLLMRIEVDGVNSSTSAHDTSRYVEMKTAKWKYNFKKSNFKESNFKESNFKESDFINSEKFKKYKSLQWWAQSVIVGIKETICGLRDEDGIVQSIVPFDTNDLPECGQKSSTGKRKRAWKQKSSTGKRKRAWKPQTCFNFCNNFLTYLKRFLVENDPSIVYQFHYNGEEKICVSELSDSDFQVLSEEFLLKAEAHYKNSETTEKAKLGASQNQ